MLSKMIKVIAVFDIGKTNKKLLLFDSDFEVVCSKTVRFEEIIDDDGDPCDDIEAIENWVQKEIELIQQEKKFQIKAINFSTHGATLVYLDKQGNRITPLYNYLKPLDYNFHDFYETYEGVEEFSRKTASPAYGMLNVGLQMLWLKKTKPHFWQKISCVLHYPQYLSYLFTRRITADFTSVGAHTAIWDFDKMTYHNWLEAEQIKLEEPKPGHEACITEINGEKIAVGMGLHDSSSSIIPLLQAHKNLKTEFILLSTGTWIICMNPFSKEVLTSNQLNNNCLCFLTPDRKQVKSSMQFLGKVHEINANKLSSFFNVSQNHYLTLKLNKKLCEKLIKKSKKVFFPNSITENFIGDFSQLDNLKSYEEAYYQLNYEISCQVYDGMERILDTNNNLKDIYISGGFNKNEVFVEFVSQMMPGQNIRFPEGKHASALGAAILLKSHL